MRKTTQEKSNCAWAACLAAILGLHAPLASAQSGPNYDEKPVPASMELVIADNGNGGEGPENLMDGDRTNKWCARFDQANVIGGSGWDAIFVAEEPVTARYYELVTANDTQGYSGRNWKTWKIYGANLDEADLAALDNADDDARKEAADALLASDKWVLLDSREGDNSLPAANFTSTAFTLNQEFEGQFKYFRVELTEIRDGETMQMSELTLLNDGNVKQQREAYYEQFSAFDTSVLAQKTLLTDYESKLAELKDATDIATIISLVNSLNSLQSQINTSAEAYTFYTNTVNGVMEDALYRDEEEFYFLKGYLQGMVEPGFGYPNGSYEYIIANALLDASQIRTEAYYVTNLYNSALNGAYIPLSGSSDNFSADEGYSALVDGDVNTKWGRNGAEAFTIFMTPAPQTPVFYTLTTANDTQSYSGRNWRSWRIYGANFNSVAEAVRDAEEWVLIDEKTGIGQDRLGAANFTPFHFGFSSEVGEYRFYKIETLEAYSGNAIQMSEFKFGNEDDYEAIRTELYDQLGEFDFEPEVQAQIALLEKYGEELDNLLQIENMEELQSKRLFMQDLQAQIAASIDIYADYTRLKNEIAATLADNTGFSGEKFELLKSYLESDEKPGDKFANGSYNYIISERQLDVEGVKAEIKVLEQMYREAVESGYAAGTEITALIANPKFYYGTEGWTVDGTVETGGAKTVMTTARAYNSEFDLRQTITGLKEGVYELVANGVFRCTPAGENRSYIATLYANDNQVFLKNIFDDYAPAETAEDLGNAYFADDTKLERETEGGASETYGYAPNSLTGMSYHFADGRYANRIMVTVKDGTLTIGIKNPGTGNTNDMTGFSNFRLFYRGTADEASAQASQTIQGMTDRANTLLAYEPTGDIYQYPNFSNEHREDLKAAIQEVANATSGQAKQDLITRISAIFADIYQSRMAYRAYGIEIERYLQGITSLLDSGADLGSQGEAGMQKATDEQDALLSGTCSTADALAQTVLKGLPFYEDAIRQIPLKVKNAYQIGTAQQLVWFAERADKANADGGTSTANVELTADIDLNDIATEGNNWKTMSTSYIYQGTFDGKGHKIFNLRTQQAFIWAFRGDLKNITVSGDLLAGGNNFNGLIGWSYEGNNGRGVSIIENVNCDINIDATKNSVQAVGGLIGYAQTGNLIIDRCTYSGNMTISKQNYLGYGGIVGYNGSGGTKISNCANYGSLTTDYKETLLGGIMGYTNAGTNTFYNNINVGKVENTSAEGGAYTSALIGRHRSHSETYYGNNYWLKGSCTQATGESPIAEDKVFEVTAEEMASGEIAYKLNEYAGETIWYQTLESDPYPVLDNTHKIVLVREDGTYYNLDGSGIQAVPAAIATTAGVGIYDLQGRLVRTAVSADSALKGLPAGIYVVRNGSQARKVLKK